MKTRKIIISALLNLFISHFMIAQISAGFHTGIHSSTTSFNGVDKSILPDINPLHSISAGIDLDIDLDPTLAISTGLNYKRKGFETGIGTDVKLGEFVMPLGVKIENSIQYFEVPALLKYKFKSIRGIRPYFAAGPSLAIAKQGYIKTQASVLIDITVNKTELPLDSDTFNRTEWIANVLGGVQIPYRKGYVTAELGYEKSMTDFMTDASFVDLGARHKGLNFNIGYGIRF